MAGGSAGPRTAIAAKLGDTDVLMVSKTKVGSFFNTYIFKAVIASRVVPNRPVSASLSKSMCPD